MKRAKPKKQKKPIRDPKDVVEKIYAPFAFGLCKNTMDGVWLEKAKDYEIRRSLRSTYAGSI